MTLRNIFQGYSSRSTPTTLARSRSKARSRIAQEIERRGNARTALSFLNRHVIVWGLIRGTPFPSCPGNVEPPRQETFESVWSALEYVALSLLPFAKHIGRLEAYREKWYDPSRTDDECLSELENAFGFSCWLSGEKIGMFPPGSNETVEYVKELLKECRDIVSHFFISNKYGLRTCSKASTDIRQFIGEHQLPHPVAALLLALLHPIPDLSKEEVNAALSIASRIPVVDRWIVLLRCTQSLVASDNDVIPQLRKLVALPRLLSSATSVEAGNLLHVLGTEPMSPIAFEPGLIENGLIHMATGTLDAVQNASVKTIVSTLLSLVGTSADWDANLAILDRNALSYAGTRLGGIYASIVGQAGSFTEKRAKRWRRWLELVSHTKVIRAFPEGNIGRYLRLYGADDATRQRLVELLNIAEQGDAMRVIALLQGGQRPLTREELAILLDAYIDVGNNTATVEVAAQVIAHEQSLARRLPFDTLSDVVPTEPAMTASEAVIRAIVTDACVRHGATSDVGTRNDCFDDVLDIAGVALPSDAISTLRSENLDPSILIYFLEKICTTAIMDTVPVGRSTEELQNERIRILNALRELDKPNESRHELEIKETAIHVAVRRELVSLNQQRVYVDTDGLKARLTNSLADDYDRYVRYRKLDSRKSGNANIVSKLQDLFPDLTLIDMSELAREATSESDRALVKMVVAVRDGFAESPDFGLDGYLSGGIRHGNLEALLREPLAKKNLLGTFSDDDRFAPPEFANALVMVKLHEKPRIEECFRNFAQSFQSIVDEVLREWVRIENSGKESPALFDLSVTSTDVRIIEADVRDTETIDSFLNYSIEYFWERVDTCLKKARKKIRSELKRRVLSAVEVLEANIRAIFAPQVVDSLLDNFLAPARGALDTAIERLCEWFQRGEAAESGFVDIRLPIQVAAQTVKGMFPNVQFDWKFDVSESSSQISRRVIKHWFDIVHALYVNAAKHGGNSAGCRVTTVCSIQETGGYIEISSDLSARSDYGVVDTAIADAMQRLNDSRAIASVRSEGGSGLIKVLKYARGDLRCPQSTLSVKRIADRFVVRLDFPTAPTGLRSPS